MQDVGENKMPEPKRRKPPSTPLADTIQANVNRDLEQHFKSFLDDEGATLEERMFLREVFEWWDSSQIGNRDEIAIASAFQEEIRNREPHILHVTDWERDQMLAYLKTLREQSEPAKEPAAESPKPPKPPARHRDRLEELKTIFAFFETKYDLELFEALRLITARDGGSSTPVENFLVALLRRYFLADQNGRVSTSTISSPN
jgi:hypothetical protein